VKVFNPPLEEDLVIPIALVYETKAGTAGINIEDIDGVTIFKSPQISRTSLKYRHLMVS
jgi:hypothetical protein